MENLAPTSGADFRRLSQEGQVRTLKTSVRVVRQRPVNLLRMLKLGKIPDELTAYVMSLVWSDKAEQERSELEKAVEWLGYLEMIAKETLLDPVIVDDPQADNEIAVEWLTYPELLELHNWAREPFDMVRPFRVEQNGNVEIRPESSESIEAAQRVRAGSGE
jgi:hypothetical protein